MMGFLTSECNNGLAQKGLWCAKMDRGSPVCKQIVTNTSDIIKLGIGLHGSLSTV